MTREEIKEVMGASEPIQASFEIIGDDVKFVKLIVSGKEKVISIEELENTLSEPCDCISREEVCDYIAEFVNHEYATDRERELVKHIIGGIQHLPSIQPTTKENLVVEDCISRKAVLDALNKWDWQELYLPVHFKDIIDDLPSIQPNPKTECSCEQIKWERDIAIEQLHELGYELGQKIEPCEDCISREFIEIVVNYPPADLCCYPEYRGKPYFSIKYRENGKYIVGYGSYKIEMISQWIKEYFMPSIQPKTELETREGIHEQVTAPKGTFDKIWNEAEDNDEI